MHSTRPLNPGPWRSNGKGAPVKTEEEKQAQERSRLSRAAAERSSRDQKNGKKPVTLSHDVRTLDYLKG